MVNIIQNKVFAAHLDVKVSESVHQRAAYIAQHGESYQ
jgi:hypothetical protein